MHQKRPLIIIAITSSRYGAHHLHTSSTATPSLFTNASGTRQSSKPSRSSCAQWCATFCSGPRLLAPGPNRVLKVSLATWSITTLSNNSHSSFSLFQYRLVAAGWVARGPPCGGVWGVGERQDTGMSCICISMWCIRYMLSISHSSA